MFVGFPMNITAMCRPACGSYVHRGTNENKVNVAPGSAWAYVAYVHRPGGTDERKGLRFVGSTWPTNVS
jgi:hypothetical protein